MKISITKKQQVRNEIDMLIKNNKFITWYMLGIYPFRYFNKFLTYDAKIVFEYMNELKIDYVKYNSKFSDRKIHGNTKGFYNDIAVRRKNKLLYIEKSLNRL